ncbi:hypothetical protein PMAYCL1PPCAC_19143 [Pristionchus mayeri]|uniref:Uncharacterized protein n=1 Tax=Pristionchus mayeri TaxID=1317129 RepID=A0AAN5CQR5_9BILA|nr:hypothetical protein PMAYCL1PPCAC_19143 [Pristionchus mayeri]
MANQEILGCHVTSVSIIFVSLTFLANVLIIGGTTFIELSLPVLLAVITIAVVEITTCGMHIVAIREGTSRMVLPNIAVSAFNILLSAALCVLSIIDVTSRNRTMGAEVLLVISPESLAVADNDDGDVSSQLSNSAPILTVSILLSTLYVVAILLNAFILHVHVKCYRYLFFTETQFTQWSDNESRASLFPELTEKEEDWEWSEKTRSITRIKEEDEDDFYYRYLNE